MEIRARPKGSYFYTENQEMRRENVTEALITGAVAIIVCLVNNIIQMRNVKSQNDKTIHLIDYKLSELTKRVDKHNNVIERTYRLEETTTLHDEKLKVVNHRIEDLERRK